MAELAVTAIGSDQPGIIARVTKVLYEHGGNLEDSSMTILGGHFAIMLLVQTDASPTELETALAEGTSDLGLVVTVRPVGHGAPAAPPTHVLSVYGADRPGIVHSVTSALADHGVNVTDLETRVLEGERPVYAMMLEISLPPDLTQDRLAQAVSARVEEVEVSIHPLDVETL
ncbi:MAG TPA: ACT domain-containing protein [Egibacteraceae bacterium]|nr:ACT domain-containing protein [Egibacteraceae bacterium]